MNVTLTPYSVLHEIYEQRNLARFRAFLSPGRHNVSTGYKGKDRESDALVFGGGGGGAGSYGASAGSISRSPRYHHIDVSGASNQPSKDEVNARDRWGRTVLHLVACESTLDEDVPLDYLEALLACSTVNVNLQDKESGWTALHRALYAGNLLLGRRILQHPDVDPQVRDLEGLTAFDVLNSTILGTNPADLLDNISATEQANSRQELITWGANRNFVLGLQGDSDRSFPERVALERLATSDSGRANMQGSGSDDAFEPLKVRKILMEKLHAGLLTDEKRGNFRLCGFGSTTGRLGHASSNTQFAFEPLKDFGLQRVTDFALGQDHTILCTDKGDLWTFGLNTFSVLGYPVETTAPSRPGLMEEPVQASPKRLVGIMKKEFVIGVAASRYHSAAFTADSLFTWGKNNGQLGYPSLATPIQSSPRKVTSLPSPIAQMCATEVATVCLLQAGEVFVLHRDGHYKINFPMTRFPTAMQVYRPPNIGPRPAITKVAGSGTTFIAMSDMGDVFTWQLDNPAMEAPSAAPTSGRDIKPWRIWEDRKAFTAVTDVCIANDTIALATRSGHVYVRSKKKELASVKGFELRSSGANVFPMQVNKKNQYKFSRVSNLQRVVGVAISSSGGFGSIRSDAPLIGIPLTNDSLAASLLAAIPHYQRYDEEQTKLNLEETDFSTPQLVQDDPDEGDDESIEEDATNLQKICRIVQKWDSSWSIPRAGADVLLIAGASGVKLPVHSTVLAARSQILQGALQGENVDGVTVSRSGTHAILLSGCGHMSGLLLVHYLYGDNVPAIYDPRLTARLQAQFPILKLDPSVIKGELQILAKKLGLSELANSLAAWGKVVPTPTLARHLESLLSSAHTADVILEASDRTFACHSIVLRSRCPFFEAMFAESDWHVPRRETLQPSQEVIKIDLKHIGSEILSIVLHHLYTNGGGAIIAARDYTRPEDKIDFVMSVLGIANELLLDGLKAVCSAIIRPLINMQTVCSILSEAIFYEADNLRKCCMQYICCNIETMLEQHMLDVLSLDSTARLAIFCRARQLNRLPRTARSLAKLEELRITHAEWLKELDVPRATGSYRRFSRRISVKSPKLSPAFVSSSFQASPDMSSALLSPPLSATNRPASPTLTESPAPSPLVRATPADESIMFDMDDLSLEEPALSLRPNGPTLARTQGSPSLSSGSPWQQRSAAGAIPPGPSLRDIMQADASSSGISPRSVETRTTPSHPNATGSPAIKLSQRDRKRQQQQAQLAQQQETKENTASSSSSPWRPLVAPTAWKPPDTPQRPVSPVVQAPQSGSPGVASLIRSPPTPARMLRNASGSSSPSLRPSLPSTASQEKQQIPYNPASAVGAPIITPTRQVVGRKSSQTGGPPETRSHDTPWVSYTSTVPVQSIQYEDPSQSFATIQHLQTTEREALRVKKNNRSLAEIQEEENKLKEEAAFLEWFEAESRRTQAELGAGSPKAAREPGQGGKKGGARGRGGQRGRGGGSSSTRGSVQGRGRGAGPASSPAKTAQSARIDD